MLVFDGVRTLDVTGPLEVFDVARSLGCDYHVQLYATTEATRVVCSSGLVLDVPAASALRAAPDTLLVPGGECLVAPGVDDALVARHPSARTARPPDRVHLRGLVRARRGRAAGRQTGHHAMAAS